MIRKRFDFLEEIKLVLILFKVEILKLRCAQGSLQKKIDFNWRWNWTAIPANTLWELFRCQLMFFLKLEQTF